MNLQKAFQAQKLLARRLRLEPLSHPLELIGGADFACDPVSGKIGAALVVFDSRSLKPVDEATAVVEIPCPYIPGYLCFREGPAFFKALRRITRPPDVWLIDGNGIAHPRRMGLASFLGVIRDIPTIGCAKTAFFPYELPSPSRGSFTAYRDREGNLVGFCLRTRTGVRPVFVSPGHRVSFEDCLRITLRFSSFRLPEPLRAAHSRARQIFLRS